MLFKIRSFCSNLSIIKQLFAVVTKSSSSKFIKIMKKIEENNGNGSSWIYTKIMQNSIKPTKPQIS